MKELAQSNIPAGLAKNSQMEFFKDLPRIPASLNMLFKLGDKSSMNLINATSNAIIIITKKSIIAHFIMQVNFNFIYIMCSIEKYVSHLCFQKSNCFAIIARNAYSKRLIPAHAWLLVLSELCQLVGLLLLKKRFFVWQCPIQLQELKFFIFSISFENFGLGLKLKIFHGVEQFLISVIPLIQ